MLRNYLVVAVDIDDLDENSREKWHNEPELFRSAAYNIVQEVMDGKDAIVFRTREERMIVLFHGESDDKLDEAALNLSEVIRYCMKKYLRFTVTVGVGTLCSALTELPSRTKGQSQRWTTGLCLVTTEL